MASKAGIKDTEIIGNGAEAVITRTGNIVRKERPPKAYRIAEIDIPIRQARTRKEANILSKLEKIGIPAPKLIDTDRKSIINMEHIRGMKLRDRLTRNNYTEYCKALGGMIAQLHDNGIIHGDLTTSNIMVDISDSLIFIDFGLSSHSIKIEDKAVDLHLLKQAFESKHYRFAQEAINIIIESYKSSSESSTEVLRRLEKVEERGRNKLKG